MAFVLGLFKKNLTPCNAQITENIFDSLLLFAPLRQPTTVMDELGRFLSIKPENVTDAVQWWYENRKTYPQLYRMALDYLTIPGKYYGARALPSGYLRMSLLMQRLRLTSNSYSVVDALFFHSQGAN